MGALQYIVEGGKKLSGTIRPSGNKNAALPIIAASLLSDQPVTLENVPRIRGVAFELEDVFRLSTPELRGADVFLDEPSVTATENAVTAAAAARGTTILRNAACEPHVQDLCHFLVAMGSSIEGVGTNKLTID